MISKRAEKVWGAAPGGGSITATILCSVAVRISVGD
jgi:hypothetical protein